jgi:hypothetical protein
MDQINDPLFHTFCSNKVSEQFKLTSKDLVCWDLHHSSNYSALVYIQNYWDLMRRWHTLLV